MNKILIVILALFAATAYAASFEKSTPYCKSGDVYVKYTFYSCPECDYEQLITDCQNGCADGTCLPCDVEECDGKDGYVGGAFCKSSEIYRKYRDYECKGGACQYTESEKKTDECFFGSCSNGACQKCDTVECDLKDGYYGSPACELNTVRKQYRDYYCSGSQCVACGDGYACSSGRCAPEIQVQECRSNSECPSNNVCLNSVCQPRPPECFADSDCATGSCSDGRCITASKPLFDRDMIVLLIIILAVIMVPLILFIYIKRSM